MISIGLDVGGTKLLGVAIDAASPSAVLVEARVPTPEGGTGLVEALVELVADLCSVQESAACVGVGVPGLVDRSGRLHMGPHLHDLHDLPLAELLSAELGVPVIVDNDANCHAVAERACGAAVGAEEALVVTFGTGIGAGIITGGTVLRGASGFAGEPGHMVVDPDGPPCPCGKRGCWERFASGTGLARMAGEAASAGRLDRVLALAGGTADAVRGEHVVASAREGDAAAAGLLTELAHWIALGLANLANLLDPAVIVVGGGLVEAADLLLPAVRDRFATLVMAAERRAELPILPAALGGRAGAIGAAVLAAKGG